MSANEPVFTLPDIPIRKPDRTAGNFYRTAEHEGGRLGGFPLANAERTVVAAVRLGYKVAEAQIDRSKRLADRLRQAGDAEAGPRSDRQALDATERLIFRGMMSGLSWLEAAAAEGGSPLKRLANAEYSLLGSMLGLTRAESRGAGPRSPDVASTAEDTVVASQTPAAAPANPLNYELRIKLLDPERRPVRVRIWHVTAQLPQSMPVLFFSAQSIADATILAEVVVEGRQATLAITTPRMASPGAWKGALCDAYGTQLGYLEIEL